MNRNGCKFYDLSLKKSSLLLTKKLQIFLKPQFQFYTLKHFINTESKKSDTSYITKRGSLIQKVSVDEFLGSKNTPLDDGSTSRSSILGSKPNKLMDHIKQLIDDNPSHIILTQVGSFYELYYHHATEIGPKLNIRVTKKRSSNSNPIPMAGFPLAQIDRHLRTLVKDLNYTVAIVDQYEKELDSLSKFNLTDNMKFDRRITRIVTPGTLIDEPFLERQENNYLLAVGIPSYNYNLLDSTPVALAWIDLTVGSFYAQTTTVANLLSDISIIQPKEILLDHLHKEKKIEMGKWHIDLTQLKSYYLNYRKFLSKSHLGSFLKYFETDNMLTKIKDEETEVGPQIIDTSTPDNFLGLKSKLESEFSNLELSCIISILDYLEEHLPQLPFTIQIPERKIDTKLMKIDSRSRHSLELTTPINSSSKKGTLLSAIKRTVSDSGSRLLNEWIRAPLVDKDEINKRHDIVSELTENEQLLDNLVQLLRISNDPVRTLQKISLGKGRISDVYALALDMQLFTDLKKTIEQNHKSKTGKKTPHLANLVEPIVSCSLLSKSILENIDEEAVRSIQQEDISVSEAKDDIYDAIDILDSNTNSFKEEDKADEQGQKWAIRSTASKKLNDLHKRLSHFESSKDLLKVELEAKFNSLIEEAPIQGNGRASKSAIKVELKSNNGGHYVYLSGSNLSRMKIDFEMEKNIVNKHKRAMSLRVPEWTQLAVEAENVQADIKTEERAIFNKMKSKILAKRHAIRANSHILDQLDVLSSFATLANECDLCRPEMTDSNTTSIVDGRHMTVEQGLILESRGIFVPNDCFLGSSEYDSNVWIITGPNMGGKSTFLRQVALITILAQMGSFVPARRAKLGIVDQIFCRVGAGDDLYRDQSTFMVEMIETTNILRNATEKSLAILDEVGRGTSTRDGVAIAFASIMHLSLVNKCRTLFATHFGKELQSLICKDSNIDIKPKRGRKSLKEKQIKAEMEYILKDIKFYCTNIDFFDLDKNDRDLIETKEANSSIMLQDVESFVDAKFSFSHKLVPGISDDSHGLRVAAMAGFPMKGFEFAKTALLNLSDNDK